MVWKEISGDNRDMFVNLSVAVRLWIPYSAFSDFQVQDHLKLI